MSLFIKTDIDIALDIEDGFTMADASSLTFRMQMGDFSLTKTIGNGITRLPDYFVLSISRFEINSSGSYDLFARITDQGGKQRGLSVSPKKLVFDKFPINA